MVHVGVVGVVGAGAMGAGIAQVALEAGEAVALFDPVAGATERARARIADGLGRRAAKLDLDADAIDDWVEGRLAGFRAVAGLAEVVGSARLVIEAAVEDLAVKRRIFAELDRSTALGTILATNTSALSVAAIAAATDHPDRVLGLHFFNPAPLMPLVEVIVTASTNPAVAERADQLMTSWGKTPVRCADSPGFIVNRVNRPFTIESLRILESGDASVEGVDGAMRDAGFPMGPFELIDLIGVDVNLATARGIWEGLGRPERLRPSPIQEALAAAGDLGRKSGRGFYTYVDGRRATVAPRFAALTDRTDPEAIRRRILGAIDAEAALAVDAGLASAADIALALRLGAGHPAR